MSSTVSLDYPASQARPAALDLPAPADILYPDFGSALSLPSLSDEEQLEPSLASAPAFVIDTMAKADWCISRILEAQARLDSRASLASELHARIDAWLTKASASDSDSVSFLTDLLRPYAESEISKQHRSRSLVLPSGTAQLRKLPDRLDITDPEAALAWAADHAPDAIVIKKEISRSTLKSLIFKAGEAVPGVAAELGPDALFIKPNA